MTRVMKILIIFAPDIANYWGKESLMNVFYKTILNNFFY
jgi:hypothetical protein